MLCLALVHLQDWPRNEAREVDETSEEILGKLRAHLIVPLVRPSVTPSLVESEPPTVSVGPALEAGEEPAPPARPAARKKRA